MSMIESVKSELEKLRDSRTANADRMYDMLSKLLGMMLDGKLISPNLVDLKEYVETLSSLESIVVQLGGK